MRRSTPGLLLFVVAMVVGLVHAAASLYWALGGSALLETVGQFAVDMRREGGVEVTVMLALITVVKAAGAVVPWWDHARPPAHRWVRAVSWVGATVLLVWGGAGMVGAWIGLAVGAGPTPALIGHAFLWVPLFVAWGAALGAGLWCSRRAPTSSCAAPA